jgi:pyridoxamine 5'-phosphate oxidase
MHELPEDVAALQELLDRSYANAGAHLLSIHTPERRLSATGLCERLEGMRLLALATVSGDGRPIVGPVDGIFYRGAFHFGSSPDSIRFRHIRALPWVSATHAPCEEFGVTVHGRAVPIDVRSERSAGFRQTLLDVYLPRYGAQWEQFLDSGPVYARIDAERMFAFFMAPAAATDPGHARPLREQDADPDPFRQFSGWFEEARRSGVRAPEAAALATATPGGAPSLRIVLIKEAGAGGFVFYSSYESRKGQELAANPRAALLFHWDALGRQIRVEGPVQRLSREESTAYVRSRPRASQLGALASPQSQPIASRELLERRAAELAARYADVEPPLPEAWGGYRLLAETFEFWQHRDDRLHDRLRYAHRPDGSWELTRLAP